MFVAQSEEELLDLCLGPLDFDAYAISLIGDRAGQPERVGQVKDKGAKADALHNASHGNRQSLHVAGTLVCERVLPRTHAACGGAPDACHA